MPLVLHIDDEKVILDLVEERLKKVGIDCARAHNGEEGIKAIEALKPDLVLMDIDMPILDGYAAAQQLREDGYQGFIAALTGSQRVRDLADAIVAGCDDFIDKPIPSDLEDRVLALLAEAKTRDETADERSAADQDLDDQLFSD